MGLEEKLRRIGIRNRVGLASIGCSNRLDQIRKAWEEAGIGYIILKTMMDSDDRPGEPRLPGEYKRDYNMTLCHTGTTSKEQWNFETDHLGIIGLINTLLDEDIAIIPSIGTKKTDEGAWEMMERTLAYTSATVIELNLRYTYRGLVLKYANEVKRVTGRDFYCDEYFTVHPDKALRIKESDRNYIRECANADFDDLLGKIRRIFPENRYALIAKLWPSLELEAHMTYVAENGFDAVTLVNSIKDCDPKPMDGIPRTKLPQMSGMVLRGYRNDALELARKIGYKLSIFASGGVAAEVRRNPESIDGKELADEKYLQKNLEDGVADVRRCFELGALYVQLGSGIYKKHYRNFNCYEVTRLLMEALGDGYKMSTHQSISRAA